MQTFYFTYGSDKHFPFHYGWTEIVATDKHTACKIFQAFHPNREGSTALNCADIYTEAEFSKTVMSKEGNFSKFCWERITVTHEILFEKENTP